MEWGFFINHDIQNNKSPLGDPGGFSDLSGFVGIVIFTAFKPLIRNSRIYRNGHLSDRSFCFRYIDFKYLCICNLLLKIDAQ